MKNASGIAYAGENCFNITNRGMVVDIRHHENGLPKGTVLTSVQCGDKWEVISRVLDDMALDVHKIFEKEHKEYVYMAYKTIAAIDKAKSDVRVKELNNMFVYLIKPLQHGRKPIVNEELAIDAPVQ